MDYYQKKSQEVLEEFAVKIQNGLSYDQAEARLKTYGPNSFMTAKKETLKDIFIRQFKSPLIYILIFAAILVFFLGNPIDAIVIILVITVNAVVGTIQEGKAKNSLERLKSLTKHKALVRRDGQETIVGSDEVVPGDILILREGDRVSADSRIVKAQSLKINESILTGEAFSSEKTEEKITKENLVVGDQKNMLFSGTSVVSGYCEAVVVSTGYESELGKISKGLLETSNIPLPLAQKVVKLTHLIAFAVFIIAAVSFLIGFSKGIPIRELFSAVVGLSVSIVPEGLPVAVTVVLAKGVWRMAKAKAIVRQMAAVEAMGNADTLMVDKTGTITTGKMVIKHVVLEKTPFEVTGHGYNPQGKVIGANLKDREKLIKVMSLSYLSLKADTAREHGKWKPLGDPTEVAIAVLAQKLGLKKEKLSKEYETLVAKPFDSQKRYIEAQFKKGNEKWRTFIGAPEFLNKELKIDDNLMSSYKDLAQKGMRVVGLAIYGPTSNKLYAYALFAIEEEIRPKVEDSILTAKNAGFKVVMMTGDFPDTARAIAQKIGIYKAGDDVITGSQVEELTEQELSQKIKNVTVFARITPVHKLKIVNAFKKRKHIVAMTGDGVNDGPALQAANLGIGLGSGTQIAKDSSDIVLVDDNFSTIVSAISEGRNIYLTLKKVILYLFSTSLGEVLVILSAIIIGLPLPLLAVQIIWLNFVTDGFFVVALAQETPERGMLSKKELRSENLVDTLMAKRALLMGAAMLFTALPVFIHFSSDVAFSRTMALLILSMMQWFNALNVRSKSKSVFRMSLLENKYIIGAFIIVLFLQIGAIQTPIGNKLMHTTPLMPLDWALAFTVSTSIIFVEEIRKLAAKLFKVSFVKIN